MLRMKGVMEVQRRRIGIRTIMSEREVLKLKKVR
jgi:hypothetical protein